MAKKEETKVCPKCGGKSFLSTSLGIMCKECKCIVSTFVPLPPDQLE